MAFLSWSGGKIPLATMLDIEMKISLSVKTKGRGHAGKSNQDPTTIRYRSVHLQKERKMSFDKSSWCACARTRKLWRFDERHTHIHTRASTALLIYCRVRKDIFISSFIGRKEAFFFFKLVGGQKMGGQTPLIEYIRASLSYGSSTSPISQPLKFSDFRFLFPAFLSFWNDISTVEYRPDTKSEHVCKKVNDAVESSSDIWQMGARWLHTWEDFIFSYPVPFT